MTSNPRAFDLRRAAGLQLADCISELDIALHGKTWQRPAGPEEVWQSLLDEVRELVNP